MDNEANSIYTVDYFIKKFEVIPNRGWYVGDYYNPNDPSQKCAAGWCGGNSQGMESEEATAFYMVICQLGKGETIAQINDGKSQYYKQPTPKARILAALHDIKAKQQPIEQPKQEPKVVYKTVVIDSAVKELQENLTDN